MRREIAHPCKGACATVRKIRRSSVPCRRSSGLMLPIVVASRQQVKPGYIDRRSMSDKGPITQSAEPFVVHQNVETVSNTGKLRLGGFHHRCKSGPPWAG